MKTIKQAKSHLFTSFKTTLAGLVMAAGNGLTLAPLIGWYSGDHRHLVMVIGWWLSVIGAFLIGVAARDHNVRSEQATEDSQLNAQPK